eukprot:1180701-Prorocentrum_minimum.AAC.2
MGAGGYPPGWVPTSALCLDLGLSADVKPFTRPFFASPLFQVQVSPVLRLALHGPRRVCAESNGPRCVCAESNGPRRARAESNGPHRARFAGAGAEYGVDSGGRRRVGGERRPRGGVAHLGCGEGEGGVDGGGSPPGARHGARLVACRWVL